MERIETELPGAVILEPRVFRDERGYFVETFNERTLAALGIDTRFVQDNESCSRRGVLRGLHFQKGPSAQAKLVRVVSGEVFDVAVDLRAGSPTFGRWMGVRLSGDNHRQFFIPKGFAHGFAVLSETAIFAYKCDAFYDPQAEGSIHALDPALGIDWPISPEACTFSPKDLAAPSWANYATNPVFHWEAS